MTRPASWYAGAGVGARFARLRPQTQGPAAAEIAAFLGDRRADRVLDVGCGTGDSTTPLTRVGRQVIDVDAVPAMVRQAHETVRAGGAVRGRRLRAAADRTGTCDLITVCSAFHWFRGPAFLTECRRVGRPGSTLALYSNALIPASEDCAAFAAWFREVFQARYPRVQAPNTIVDESGMAAEGFRLQSRRHATGQAGLDADQLAGLLTTRSNVIAAVRDQGPSLEQVHAELAVELATLMDRQPARFEFGGDMFFYRVPSD